jgi:hypothetical protein
MANLDEPNPTGGGGNGEEPIPVEKMSRPALEARVRELEKENAGLKLDIEALALHVKRDAELLHAITFEGIPLDKQELEESKANSKSISDLIAEFGDLESPR